MITLLPHEMDPEEAASSPSFDRRQFLQFLGCGIVVYFLDLDWIPAQEARRPSRDEQGLPSDFNAFLHVGEDGRVTCFTGKIEMGQGIITSLTQMIAEELDLDDGHVDMLMGDTDRCPWDMGTFGSRTTKYFGPALRQAAAEARAVLIELAVEHLKVPKEQLTTKAGAVQEINHPEHRVSYAALTKGKQIERHLGQAPALKPAKTYTHCGKPLRRRDGLEKVTGKAQYAGDIRLPGMLYAKILRLPAHGAKLTGVDISAAEKIDGMKVVRDGDLVAALHPLPDIAERGLAALKAQFEQPVAKVDDNTLFQYLSGFNPEGETIAQSGNLEKGKELAASLFEETYHTRYVAHATIETHTALVQVQGGKATVWASTQRPFGARDEVAQVLGITAKDVRVITPFVGAGFGGKSRNLQVVQAARLAKLTGRPVQVSWSREDEFFHDTFMPAAIVKIQSGLTASQQMSLWDYHVYYAGDRGSATFYDVPHHRTTSYGGWSGAPGTHPFGTGAWRAPACNTNTFARESHVDLMAAKVGADPLAFRLANLKDPRMQRVLETVKGRFGWVSANSPSRRGQGMACGIYLGTYIAAMAEIEVDQKSGKIAVKRIVCAQDMGEIINPEGARQQMEGALMMGLGYALTEEIHFKGGDVLDRNFDSYQIPRFSWLPKIDALLVDNPEVPAQGGGEPAITLMGGLIANALSDATGARLFELPLSPARVLKVLSTL